MQKDTIFGMNEILELLPHRPPFLFVDRIVKFVADTTIVAERVIRKDEPWFAGHFPQKPIMPGVLITDALAQTSGLLWGFSRKMSGEKALDVPEIFFLASAKMKYVSPAYPGETLELTSNKTRFFGSMYSYDVEAATGRKLIAKGSLTLAMKGSPL